MSDNPIIAEALASYNARGLPGQHPNAGHVPVLPSRAASTVHGLSREGQSPIREWRGQGISGLMDEEDLKLLSDFITECEDYKREARTNMSMPRLPLRSRSARDNIDALANAASTLGRQLYTVPLDSLLSADVNEMAKRIWRWFGEVPEGSTILVIDQVNGNPNPSGETVTTFGGLRTLEGIDTKVIVGTDQSKQLYSEDWKQFHRALKVGFKGLEVIISRVHRIR